MQIVKHRGKWAIQYGAGSERRRFSTGLAATPENREAAERKKDEFRQQMSAPVGNKVTDIMEAYLDDSQAISIASLRFAWARIKPHFGALTPDQIDRDSCRRYITKRRRDGVKPGTINKELNTLRAGLRWHNKNTPAEIEMLPAPPARDRWLTREEFARLLDAAAGIEHLEVFLHLAIATAGRKEALLSLTWTQVDFKRGQIWLGAKPNGKRRATVPMTDSLRAVLERAKKRNVSEHVVEYRSGRVASIKKAFRSAADTAKLDNVTIHDLRHTAAVWMAGAGVPMSKISQYLGHSSTSVTERIYARYQPDHLRDAAAALEV